MQLMLLLLGVSFRPSYMGVQERKWMVHFPELKLVTLHLSQKNIRGYNQSLCVPSGIYFYVSYLVSLI